jgi:hypothetical protein
MMTPAQFKRYYSDDPETATLELAKVTEKSHLGEILRYLTHNAFYANIRSIRT